MKAFFATLVRFSSSWTGTIIIVLLLIFFIAQAFTIPSRSMVGTLYEGDFLFVKKFSYGVPIPRIPWIELPVFPDLKGNGHIIEGDRPQRGDIVVFIPPHSPKQYYVKRTFAVGGDEVVFTPKGLYLHPKEGNDYVLEHYKNENLIEVGGKLFVFDPYFAKHFGVNNNGGHSAFFEMSALYQGALLANRSPYQYTQEKRGIAMEPIIHNEQIGFFHTKIAEDEFFMIGDNRNNSEDSRFWGSVPYKNIIGKPWFTYFSMNLAGSIESGATYDTRQRYSVRWERMFKGLDGLEELARIHADDHNQPSMPIAASTSKQLSMRTFDSK